MGRFSAFQSLLSSTSLNPSAFLINHSKKHLVQNSFSKLSKQNSAVTLLVLESFKVRERQSKLGTRELFST